MTTETRRYETCPACHGAGELPHRAHQKIVCARCDRDLGLNPCHPENTTQEWWGLCKGNCTDLSHFAVDNEIRIHNEQLRKLDLLAKQKELANG